MIRLRSSLVHEAVRCERGAAVQLVAADAAGNACGTRDSDRASSIAGRMRCFRTRVGDLRLFLGDDAFRQQHTLERDDGHFDHVEAGLIRRQMLQGQIGLDHEADPGLVQVRGGVFEKLVGDAGDDWE